MSNSKNILYLISLILLMLTGCEADSSLAPFPNEGKEPVEIRFHAISVGASVDVSRAPYEEKGFETDDQIGIWNEFYSNISLTYNNNPDAEYNLSTTDNSTIYYPFQTNEMTVYAYAPYSDEAYNSNNNTVLVRSEWEEGSDYSHYITDPLWAKTTDITKDAPTANLEFTHQMARLKIKIVPQQGITYEKYKLILTFNCPQYGTMSLEDGKIRTVYSLGTDTDAYNYEETYMGTSEMPTEYDHTILPGSGLKSISVRFTEEKGKNYEYIGTFQTSPSFENGKVTNMVIYLEKLRDHKNTKVY